MKFGTRAIMVGLGLGAVAWLMAALAPDARAITFGEEDCDDNLNNIGCAHPNTVSVSGFRAPRPGENVDGVASGRCSGSLLSADSDKVIILTAGHCVSFYLASIQNGTLIDVGVSFDAEIVRDIPNISTTSWSPEQYVLGGSMVLPREYGPQGLNAFNLHFDYGLIVLAADNGMLATEGGEVIDATAIAPVILPDPGFLETIANVKDPPLFTAVGYGTGEAHKKPREGGRRGAGNDLSTLGVRLQTIEGTAFIGFLGPNRNLMMGSQNPARGHDGTCGGDSGGPIFYDDGGVELQVGVTSSGDSICRGSAIIARTEAPEAQEFLSCALDAASIAEVEDCGCTVVDSQGECAD